MDAIWTLVYETPERGCCAQLSEEGYPDVRLGDKGREDKGCLRSLRCGRYFRLKPGHTDIAVCRVDPALPFLQRGGVPSPLFPIEGHETGIARRNL